MTRMRARLHVSAVTLVILVGVRPVMGQDTPLSTLLATAEANSPRILAATRAAEAAEARVPQAGALPDPTLGVGIMNLPVADPSLGRDMMTMTRVQVGEQFPWPGKRGLRGDIARFRAEAARQEVERVRDEVLADLKSTYFRIYFLDHALNVTGHNERLIGDFARIASAKYGVGGGAQSDVLRAQVEHTGLTDQRVALLEERASAVARLNALLARPSDIPLTAAELPEDLRAAALRPPRGELSFASALSEFTSNTGSDRGSIVPTVAELQGRAFENNPMIQAHVRRVAAQERAVALAEKAALPDVHVSVGYGRRPDFGDFIDMMVSVPLPIFSGRKQSQAVLEEAAILSQHEAQHHDMVNTVNAEIASLVAELQRSREQLLLLNEGILPQARTALSSAIASYQVGRVDFLALLDTQVTLYRYELDYHRLLSDFASGVAALERTVGTEILR